MLTSLPLLFNMVVAILTAKRGDINGLAARGPVGLPKPLLRPLVQARVTFARK